MSDTDGGSGFDADVAVIGLGAVGASAAWRLGARGLDVLGFEQFEPGNAWGGSTGKTRLFRVACLEHPGLTPIARRARDLWRELEASSGQRLFLESGGLMIGPPDSHIIEGTLAAAEAHDLPVERLDADEIARRFPAHARLNPGDVGVWDPEAGILRPEAAIVAAVDAARAAGAGILTNMRVIAIEPDADGVTIRTENAEYGVRRVAVTSGPWITRFVPDLPLTPHRVVMTWFRARAGHTANLDTLPVFIRSVPGRDTWIWGHGAVPGDRADGFGGIEGFDVKVGPEFDGPFTADDPDAIDRDIHPGETDEIRDLVAATFPDVEPEPSGATTCIMTHTPDGQFVVGPTMHARVVVGGGCSGHSFKHASALGELVAQSVVGEPAFTDASFLDPRRFERSDRSRAGFRASCEAPLVDSAPTPGVDLRHPRRRWGMAKDLLVTLEDAPGEGARLGEALGDAGVNIEGLCAEVDEGRASVHVLVDDVAAARAALEGAGITVERETDVLVSPALPDPDMDTPGRFGEMTRALADAGINITLVYVASRNRVVLATSDNQRATQLLQSMM